MPSTSADSGLDQVGASSLQALPRAARMAALQQAQRMPPDLPCTVDRLNSDFVHPESLMYGRLPALLAAPQPDRPCADAECLSLQALLEQPYQRRQHASRESLALDGDSSEEEGSQSDHMHATGRSILYQRLEPSACLEAQDASSRPQQGRRKHAPDRSSMQQAGPARTFSRPPSRARRALSFSHAAAHQTGMRNRLDRLQADCAQTQELLAGQLSRLTGLADGREAETSVDARSLADSAEGETDRRMQYGNAAAAAAQETFLDAVRRIKMAARKKSPDAQPQAASQLQGCFDQATASPSVVWPQLGSCQSAPGRMVDPRTAYSAREALRGEHKDKHRRWLNRQRRSVRTPEGPATCNGKGPLHKL